MEQPTKKRVRYSIEVLNLICEWETCTVVEKDIEIYLHHIINQHLTSLDPEDLHCHWKDCEGFTDSISELKRHILLHAFHSKIKCYGSNLQIRRKLSNCLSGSHSRNIVPELPDPLICGWEDCMMEYDCPEYFYRHVDGHAFFDSTKANSVQCLWQGCNRTFSDSYKVKDHLRSHTQEKQVACPTCGGMFASRTKFFDHIQRQKDSSYSKAELYACEFCPKKMTSERLLRDHIRLHVNHYKCPFCDMTCPTPSAIANHIAYRHSKEKPHSCQYCHYSCKAERDLRRHLESHSLVSTHKCPVGDCTYESRSSTCYRTHIQKAHEKKPFKYLCHLCEKAFSRGNYLSKHLLNQHKFRWPSGHCRFRYCLNEEGVYRLQTVRYESIELSEVMMRKSPNIMDEDVDNPAIESIPRDTEITNSDTIGYVSTSGPSKCTEPNIKTDALLSESHFQQINNASTSTVSVESSNIAANSKMLPVIYVPCVDSNGRTIREEPVLVKILDASAEGSHSELNPNLDTDFINSDSDQPSTVSCITSNSKGSLVLNTIQITDKT